MITPPNEAMRGQGANLGHSSRPTGAPAGRGAAPTGDRFNVGAAKMPQPPSAISPGQGAIPVDPGAGTRNGTGLDVSMMRPAR